MGGWETDQTGLVRVGARELDPGKATFIAPDPLLDAARPHTWNPYTYGAGDPWSNPDPSGLAFREMIDDGGGTDGHGTEITKQQQPNAPDYNPANRYPASSPMASGYMAGPVRVTTTWSAGSEWLPSVEVGRGDDGNTYLGQQAIRNPGLDQALWQASIEAVTRRVWEQTGQRVEPTAAAAMACELIDECKANVFMPAYLAIGIAGVYGMDDHPAGPPGATDPAEQGGGRARRLQAIRARPPHRSTRGSMSCTPQTEFTSGNLGTSRAG